MSSCVRCGKNIGLLGVFFNFNTKTGRCGDCEREVKNQLNDFQKTFIEFCENGILSEQDWEQLQAKTIAYKLNWQEAVLFVRDDAINFLEQFVSSFADQNITDKETRIFKNFCAQLLLPPKIVEHYSKEMANLEDATKIRQGGELPIVKTPSIHLETGEICYLEVPSTYLGVLYNHLPDELSVNSSQPVKESVPVEGRLIITNKKLYFLSQYDSWDITWKKFAFARLIVFRKQLTFSSKYRTWEAAWRQFTNLKSHKYLIYIELFRKKGKGHYKIENPLLAEIILNTVARMVKSPGGIPETPNKYRHSIPDKVKILVWQRDKGRCVKCGKQEKLEYDHIIPLSKGGSNTARNIQLLCETCNRSKSGNIA